jgi:hypothetical protein
MADQDLKNKTGKGNTAMSNLQPDLEKGELFDPK